MQNTWTSKNISKWQFPMNNHRRDQIILYTWEAIFPDILWPTALIHVSLANNAATLIYDRSLWRLGCQVPCNSQNPVLTLLNCMR